MPTEDHLRDALAHAAQQAPAGGPPTAETLTAGRRSSPSTRRRWLNVAATAVVVIAIAATVTVALRHSQSNPASASGGATPGPTTNGPITSSRTASGPATATPATTGPVEITLIVDHTVVRAGQPITGRIELTNTTGTPLPLRGHGCGLGLGAAVGLSSATVTFNPPIASSTCSKTYQLAPRTTTVPVTILTTAESWAGCNSCSGQPQPPPLAGGTYQTTIILIDSPAGTAPPRPLSITLTN